jgi:hypothetical protein
METRFCGQFIVVLPLQSFAARRYPYELRPELSLSHINQQYPVAVDARRSKRPLTMGTRSVEGINFDAGVLGCKLSICLAVVFISSALSNDYFFDECAPQKTDRFPKIRATKSGAA